MGEEEEEEEKGVTRESPANVTPPTGSKETSSTESVPTAAPGGKDFDDVIEEDSFDHGWKAWSQVVASFVLFINTWYVCI